MRYANITYVYFICDIECSVYHFKRRIYVIDFEIYVT